MDPAVLKRPVFSPFLVIAILVNIEEGFETRVTNERMWEHRAFYTDLLHINKRGRVLGGLHCGQQMVMNGQSHNLGTHYKVCLLQANLGQYVSNSSCVKSGLTSSTQAGPLQMLRMRGFVR